MNYAEFAEKYNVTLSAQAVDSRPDGVEWGNGSVHFQVTATCNAGTIWSGFYSVGSAHPVMWAKKNKKLIGNSWAVVRGARIDDIPIFGGKMNLRTRELLDLVIDVYKRKAPLQPADILESLATDWNGADQLFEDWAGDLGYDEDSRAAYKIWEQCRDGYLFARKNIGQSVLDELLECEEE